MSISIDELGFSKEDILDRVVESVADKIMTSERFFDEMSESEIAEPTPFAVMVQQRVRQRIDDAVDEVAAKHIAPSLTEFLENFCLQETNRWGEKVGEPVTFIEYLTARAEAWMKEPVNHRGNTKSEDRHSWSQHSTRVAHMIDSHLQFSVESAMTNAFKDVNNTIAGGLAEAINLALANALEKIKIEKIMVKRK